MGERETEAVVSYAIFYVFFLGPYGATIGFFGRSFIFIVRFGGRLFGSFLRGLFRIGAFGRGLNSCGGFFGGLLRGSRLTFIGSGLRQCFAFGWHGGSICKVLNSDVD